jgi:alpha-N-arabinofuranosidase
MTRLFAGHFHVACLGLAGLLGVAAAGRADADGIRFAVGGTPRHRIDSRLFGHFMERASWGEPGPEGALVPGTHRLQPSVVEKLREMQIPIVRFPGGTDVDYIDWFDMIDHVPGRKGAGRPVTVGHRGGRLTNRFGLDEFLRLWETLEVPPLLVVNFRDGFLKKKPLAEAVRHEAAKVAYCNAPVGARLPEGMHDWPAVRARNGHPAPYGVRYWEIGNETWPFVDDLRRQGWADERIAEWYVECLAAYIDAMRAVDPKIEILVDVQLEGSKRVQVTRRIRRRLGDGVQYFVHHTYVPWGIRKVERDGRQVPVENLSAEDIWNAWVAVPQMDAGGLSTYDCGALREARRLGYPLAVTEWNWNGWWRLSRPGVKPALNSSFAKGVGAAGYLHAFLRQGETIAMACQSMLVGNHWGIHCIRADPTGKTPAHYMPTGQVTMFYARHHGTHRLDVTAENVPTYAQPYRMQNLGPKKRVAYVDAVATADARTVYFHAINRHFGRNLPVVVDLTAFDKIDKAAIHRILEGRLNDEPAAGEPRQIGRFRTETVALDGKVLRVTLPKRSVSIVGIPRTAAK